MTIALFFAIEVVSLVPFHYYFLQFLVHDRPFAAIGIKTGIAGCAAAARIIGNHVIHKIFITGVGKLVRFARLKEKRVARSNFSYPIIIANAAAP